MSYRQKFFIGILNQSGGRIELTKLFSLLVTQHKHIWQQLAVIESELYLKDTTLCEERLEELEQNIIQHYASEQSGLFEKVFDKPKLKEGGAFCTFYFDTFMNHRPFAQLTKFMKKIKPEFQGPSPTAENKKYFTAGSPLTIPCEEHIAILSLVQELRLELKSKKAIDWNWVESATQLLKTWIKANHEKEENCLFPHLSILLS